MVVVGAHGACLAAGGRRGIGGWIAIVVIIPASGDGDGHAGQHRKSGFNGELTPRQQVLVAHRFLLAAGAYQEACQPSCVAWS
jgi:hypothetical protein